MSDRQQQLMRLADHAYLATRHIDSSVSAEELYTDAASIAEQRIPGALGTAVAGVLAIAAENRRVSRLRGSLGEHHTMLALAVAVLESAVDTPPEEKP